jgi:hypothetical protein
MECCSLPLICHSDRLFFPSFFLSFSLCWETRIVNIKVLVSYKKREQDLFSIFLFIILNEGIFASMFVSDHLTAYDNTKS